MLSLSLVKTFTPLFMFLYLYADHYLALAWLVVLVVVLVVVLLIVLVVVLVVTRNRSCKELLG